MKSIEIVLPVLNEEKVLESSVRKLHTFLSARVPGDWRITIADNGSTDRTQDIGRLLEAELARVSLFHIPEAGRGRALSLTWLASEAHVLAYMDIDLSTDLEDFPELCDSIARGEADVTAGTRLGKGARTTRSFKREVLSRGFVLMINAAFGTRLRDTQCGFKAISRECAQALLPLVKDTGWFWDTELLLLAAKGGWRVRFVPVHWIEDTDTRVKIVKTVWRDVKGLLRMHRGDAIAESRRRHYRATSSSEDAPIEGTSKAVHAA
jgi:glycosyltransferase involved in cell wall biosynthesis